MTQQFYSQIYTQDKSKTCFINVHGSIIHNSQTDWFYFESTSWKVKNSLPRNISNSQVNASWTYKAGENHVIK